MRSIKNYLGLTLLLTSNCLLICCNPNQSTEYKSSISTIPDTTMIQEDTNTDSIIDNRINTKTSMHELDKQKNEILKIPIDTPAIPPEAYQSFLDKFLPKELPVSITTARQLTYTSPKDDIDELFKQLKKFNQLDYKYFINNISNPDFHKVLGVSTPWEEHPVYIFQSPSQSFNIVMTLYTGKYGNSIISPYGSDFGISTFDQKGKLISSIPFAYAALNPVYNDEIEAVDSLSVVVVATGQIDEKLFITYKDNVGQENETTKYYQIEADGYIREIIR